MARAEGYSSGALRTLALWAVLAATAGAQPPAAPPPPPPPPDGFFQDILEADTTDAAEAPLATEPLVPRAVPDLVDRYRDDPDFQYADPKAEGPSLWERFWDWIHRTFWKPMMESTTADGRAVALTVLAVVGLAWVVARLLRAEGSGGLFVRSGPAAPGVSLLDVDDIAEVDLGTRLREALAAGDHREAVRVRYLAVLQALDAARALAWRRDKTNREYLAEVARAAPDLADPFRQATRVFDAVWYGERPVSAARYARLAPLFDAASPREVAT